MHVKECVHCSVALSSSLFPSAISSPVCEGWPEQHTQSIDQPFIKIQSEGFVAKLNWLMIPILKVPKRADWKRCQCHNGVSGCYKV